MTSGVKVSSSSRADNHNSSARMTEYTGTLFANVKKRFTRPDGDEGVGDRMTVVARAQLSLTRARGKTKNGTELRTRLLL